MRSALVLALLAGCYQPAYEDCQITCANNVCPSGLSCVAGMCRTTTGPCGGGGSADAAEAGAWTYRKRIVLPPFPEVVREFPLLVNRVDPDLASRAKVDGSDIKFMTVDGVKLAHEIESYDKGSGHLIAWVRVPQVLTTGTELFMYYGNAQAAAQADPAGVWDPSYLGVWHLADPSGTAVQDSTAGNVDGARSNNNAPASFPAGQIAGSFSFASSGVDFFGLATLASLDAPALTFEAWIRRDVSTAAVYRRLFETPPSFATPMSILYPDDGVGLAGGNPQSLIVDVRGGSTNQITVQTEAQSFSSNSWYHVGVSLQNNVPEVYLNGVKRTVTSFGINVPHENPVVTIGGRLTATGTPTDGVSGLLDEARLSKTNRPGSYFALSYASQSKPDFLTFGPAEPLR